MSRPLLMLQDIADLLMTTLMSVLEDPSTRQFVRPHLELHQLLSGFTDLDYPAGPERAHLWQVGLIQLAPVSITIRFISMYLA